MQVIQAIHQLSITYHTQYWTAIIGLLLAICAGWYTLGRWQVATVMSPAPAGLHIVMQWRPRPFMHSVLVQVGGVSVLGRLESSDTHMAASVAIRVNRY